MKPNGAPNGNGHRNQSSGISEKQLDLINRIVRENNANKTGIDNMAVKMFTGAEVPALVLKLVIELNSSTAS